MDGAPREVGVVGFVGRICARRVPERLDRQPVGILIWSAPGVHIREAHGEVGWDRFVVPVAFDRVDVDELHPRRDCRDDFGVSLLKERGDFARGFGAFELGQGRIKIDVDLARWSRPVVGHDELADAVAKRVWLQVRAHDRPGSITTVGLKGEQSNDRD